MRFPVGRERSHIHRLLSSYILFILRLQFSTRGLAPGVFLIQEFFITMLLSNISSLIKKEADEKIADTADESNKYEYQANRNFIIGAIVINLPKILCNVFEVSKINSIYIEAIRCKSQIQPNRSFPRRKNKMRCQKHYGNKKTTL